MAGEGSRVGTQAGLATHGTAVSMNETQNAWICFEHAAMHMSRVLLRVGAIFEAESVAVNVERESGDVHIRND
jgi:hypothetical protein